MMVHVPINQCAGIVIYLLAITGISLVGVKLLSVVANQGMALALPHLDNAPPKLSLIEQRRIDATMAIPPLREQARTQVITLEAPSMPATIFAARLDLAEKEDLIESASFTFVGSAADGSLEPSSHPSSIAAPVDSYEMATGSAHRPKFRTARSKSKYAAVTTRDVFNRSFGVLCVAAN